MSSWLARAVASAPTSCSLVASSGTRCAVLPTTSAACLRKTLPLTRAHGCATSSASRRGHLMADAGCCQGGGH
eukprot:11171697-Lingulodinium_polyedra.AAC.1